MLAQAEAKLLELTEQNSFLEVRFLFIITYPFLMFTMCRIICTVTVTLYMISTQLKVLLQLCKENEQQLVSIRSF